MSGHQPNEHQPEDSSVHQTTDSEIEILLEMYRAQVSRSEHYDNLRATITNLVITLSSALVALAALDGSLSRVNFWNGLLVILIGAFGYVGSNLHGQRSRIHGKRAGEYRKELDILLPEVGINKIRNRVPEKETNLYRVWNYMHIAIIIIGVFICALALLA